MNTTFFYVGIRVKDLHESIDFYVNVLGMNLEGPYKITETKGEIATLKSNSVDVGLELNYYPPESPYYTPYTVGEGIDHLAFKVENLNDALSEAERLGYPCIQEVKSGNNRWAYIEDPNGIWIELN